MPNIKDITENTQIPAILNTVGQIIHASPQRVYNHRQFLLRIRLIGEYLENAGELLTHEEARAVLLAAAYCDIAVADGITGHEKRAADEFRCTRRIRELLSPHGIALGADAILSHRPGCHPEPMTLPAAIVHDVEIVPILGYRSFFLSQMFNGHYRELHSDLPSDYNDTYYKQLIGRKIHHLVSLMRNPASYPSRFNMVLRPWTIMRDFWAKMFKDTLEMSYFHIGARALRPDPVASSFTDRLNDILNDDVVPAGVTRGKNYHLATAEEMNKFKTDVCDMCPADCLAE